MRREPSRFSGFPFRVNGRVALANKFFKRSEVLELITDYLRRELNVETHRVHEVINFKGGLLGSRYLSSGYGSCIYKGRIDVEIEKGVVLVNYKLYLSIHQILCFMLPAIILMMSIFSYVEERSFHYIYYGAILALFLFLLPASYLFVIASTQFRESIESHLHKKG